MIKKTFLPLLIICAASLSALGQTNEPASAPPATVPPAPAVATPPPETPLQAGYKVCRDVTYATVDGQSLKLDVYMPEKPTGPLPTLIFVHGGGWGAGDKNSWDKNEVRFKDLLYQGYIIVSINYRLTSHWQFPTQIEDCKGAIRFLRANAATYSIDPTRIGVLGTSAGGHLAALLGTSGDVKELEGNVGGNLDQSSRIQCVVDVTGATDLVACMESKLCVVTITRFLGGTPAEKPDLARAANPITYVTKDSPPFLIFHPEHDFAVPLNQSQLLLAALQAAGVESSLQVHKMAHTWFDIKLVSDFFDAHLKKGQVAGVNSPSPPGSPNPAAVPQ